MATACAKYDKIDRKTTINPEAKNSIINDCAAEKVAKKNPFYTLRGVFTDEMREENETIRNTLRQELDKKLEEQENEYGDLSKIHVVDESLDNPSESIKQLVNNPRRGGKKRKMESKKKRRKNKNRSKKTKTKSRSRRSSS